MMYKLYIIFIFVFSSLLLMAKDSPVIEKDMGYSPVGKRDPFQSFVYNMKQKRKDALRHPLQKFELSELKLIGIVTDIPVPKAMFQDPNGKGWIVKKGTHIGKYFGKVKTISKDKVTVVEEYRDRFGKLTINEITIKLNDGAQN